LTQIGQCLTMYDMSETVTIRLDAEMGRALRKVVRRRKSTKSAVIKNALRNELKTSADEPHQTALGSVLTPAHQT